MDKKPTVVWMLVFFLLVLAWGPVANIILKKMGYETAQHPASQPTTLPTAYQSGLPSTNPSVASTQNANANGWDWDKSVTPQPVTLGSTKLEDPTWRLGVALSANGAGLEQAVINKYKLTQHADEPFTYEKPGKSFPALTRTMAVRQVIVNGEAVDVTAAVWKLSGETNDSDSQKATYELTLLKNGKPALTLQRVYTVYRESAVIAKVGDVSYTPLGYEARVVTTFKNLTDLPLNVALMFNGPSVPLTEAERGPDAYYLIARAPKGRVSTIAWGVDSIKGSTAETPFTDLLEKPKQREGQPYWVASTTTYFLSIFRFDTPAGQLAPADLFDSVDARSLTPTEYGRNREVELLITTKPTAVAAGASSEISGWLYMGPKKREILTNKLYSAPWVQYDQSLVITQGICAICTWQWLVNILFFILKSFHYVTRDWGLAIIGLVILVRILLHPISKKAQINMLKMQKLAPEMERIKLKHKDDQEAMQREMMRFYKENGSTQIMGCLPMFLQMPVWIALWQAMNTTFELRHQPFLYNLTWIKDLSKPDHLLDFGNSYHLPILSFVVISGLNVMPFLFGALQYIQFKIQPKPPSMTPEQEQQQKMTQWMMLIMMPVLLYASPSGLMIYMITSFLLGIAESKIVKKQFAHMQEEEARFTFVDGETPSVQKPQVRRAGTAKRSGIFGKIDEIRARMEQAQREMEKNRRKGK